MIIDHISNIRTKKYAIKSLDVSNYKRPRKMAVR